MSRQPAVSLSSRCTSRGFWPLASRSTSSIWSTCRVVPEPPCTASPAGLFSTSTSASSYSVIALIWARVFCCASESCVATLGASSRSGGMRTLWPALRRSLLSARLPSTRNSPFRTMRWMCENDSPGKRASRKRSTRMLSSSGVTVTVCTLVGKLVGKAACALAARSPASSRGGRRVRGDSASPVRRFASLRGDNGAALRVAFLAPAGRLPARFASRSDFFASGRLTRRLMTPPSMT